MWLYIVRHAHAGQHGDPNYPDDSLRPLTDEGRKRFGCLAQQLVERGVQPSIVATSPFVRCRQTADILARALGKNSRLVELSELAPGSELAALVAWTQSQSADEVAWVGHSPDVERLAAALISHGGAQIRFSKGCVAAIEFSDEIAAAGGELRWLATQKLLGC